MSKFLDSTGLSTVWAKIKSSFVSTVGWDSTNKKITKTINGSTTDVVALTGANTASSAISGKTTVDAALSDLSSNKVPTTRKVNSKALSADVTLSGSDIVSGQMASGNTVNQDLSALSGQIGTEATARENADTALSTRINNVADTIDIKNLIDTSGGVQIEKAIKRNNVVMITGTTPKITTPNTFINIGSLPLGYYSIISRIIGSLTFATASDLGRGSITISTAGNISVFYDKETTYGLQFTFTYII